MVPIGSNDAGMLPADRIGAIALSSVVSAVAIAERVMPDGLLARSPGLPDCVSRAETAVVSGVTLAMTGASLVVFAVATTE